MEFYATCGRNLEQFVATELKDQRAQRVRPLTGGVAFFGDLEAGYRACLWSRVASRILLILERIDATTSDELYKGIFNIAWEEHIGTKATLAVDAHGRNDNLRNTQFVAVRTKDAIVDRIRNLRGERPGVDTQNPDVLINVSLRGNRATVAIDLSGSPLHRRGYRVAGKQATAPLKENLAAALLMSAQWHQMCESERAIFIDPLCGSGTIAIEAALMACNRAPGLLRSSWGFDGWLGHDSELWNRLLDEADERAEEGEKSRAVFFASDRDKSAVAYAQQCAMRAGIGKRIAFRCTDVAALSPSVISEELHMSPRELSAPLLVATNPPYGERMATTAELPALYASISTLVNAEEMASAQVVAITPDVRFAPLVGRPVKNEVEVYNGPIKSTFWLLGSMQEQNFDESDQKDGSKSSVLTSSGHQVTLKDGRQVPVIIEASDQFAARLWKVWHARKRWAKKDGTSSFRIYDADLPDYAVAIDVYHGAGPDEGKRFVHLAEYRAPAEIELELAAARLSDAVAITCAILQVDPSHVFVKERRKSKGGAQYQLAQDSHGSQAKTAIIEEDGILFEIDLSSRLDTGIFLDHRPVRRMIQKESAGKRFLNLFAYTGTATCHAIEGEARETVTVDLSQTYLDMTSRNFELNGFNQDTNKLVKSDVIRWISDVRHSSERFDFIFCDVPTFSNSKEMGRRSFEVQRDHVELIIDVSRALTRDGKAIFACNRQDFVIDIPALSKANVQVEDISTMTIPKDFERTPNIHKAFIITRKWG